MHDRAADYQQAALDGAAGPRAWRPGSPETGIAACPGSNETSRTHASALWAADYALNAAQLGITRIGFHSSMLTCKGGPPMSAICSGGAYLKPQWRDVRPGQLLRHLHGRRAGGRQVPEAGQSKGGGLTFSYALQNADGSTTVVIVNENDPEKAAQTEVTLELPGRPLTGTMTQLPRPQLRSRGQTVIDGAKSEPDPARQARHGAGFRVQVPRRSSSS